MNYKDIWQPLITIYGESEAKAVARYLLDVSFHLSVADIYSGATEKMTCADEQRLLAMLERLKKSEPVQYVTGYADFYGRQFAVDRNVLIPRPETEELCQWIILDTKSKENIAQRDILDIGTGSGCIAATLALDVHGANVSAWDIAKGALTVAMRNAKRLNAEVDFRKVDALCPPADEVLWDIIVSNPPYICQKERPAMHTNVLDNEPPTALFVPDDEPLLFYQSIAKYARKALRSGGSMYFEINPLYATDIVSMLTANGFRDIEIRHDQFGKQRLTKAIRQ